ncbi:unnamed protein product [Lactuca saligna]|uniref:Protein kinase domain-containing protein n=1 Tax=Lactuca saligna TaxID=75948 RepID=A0AA35Z2V2_LACSI|nr:unnamed protein product [Lactuca saligna]
MSDLNQFEHLKIQLKTIESATNNFSKDHCIGEGGFGKVYKGELLLSKGYTTGAIKRLDRTFGQGDSEFWKEVMTLSVYRHQNIVSLLGYCDEKGEKILVYEYACNKSLDSHLNNNNLKWVQRLKICIGAACGLAYLHNPAGTQQRVLHRDIKSSNILLDENWNASIADLGLSKLGPANQQYTFLVSNNTVGTIGYCDPVYIESGILTKESDVYSFGVVLFEVLCGRLCIINNDRRPHFVELVQKSYEEKNLNEIIWDKIKEEIHPKSLDEFSAIAYQCLNGERKKRPSMNKIVRKLKTALEHQEGLEVKSQKGKTKAIAIMTQELPQPQPVSATTIILDKAIENDSKSKGKDKDKSKSKDKDKSKSKRNRKSEKQQPESSTVSSKARSTAKSRVRGNKKEKAKERARARLVRVRWARVVRLASAKKRERRRAKESWNESGSGSMGGRESESESNSESDRRSGSEENRESGSGSEGGRESVSGREDGRESGSESEGGKENDSGSEGGRESDSESEGGRESDSESGGGRESDSKSETDAGIDGGESEGGSGNEGESGSESESESESEGESRSWSWEGDGRGGRGRIWGNAYGGGRRWVSDNTNARGESWGGGSSRGGNRSSSSSSDRGGGGNMSSSSSDS